MAKVNLMSQKEYAVHRGCSAVAVHKAVKEGRISIDSDGKIDPVVADIQWAQNTRARVNKAKTPQAEAVAAAPAAAPTLAAAASPQADLVDGATEPEAPEASAGADGSLASDPKYNDSRASREEAVARREWLRLLEDEGQLVRIDQVRANLATRLAPVREALMQLPARLAPMFAAETNAAQIQNSLEAAIHEVLARLRPE